MTPITLEVITYLNEKANTNFKPCTDKTKRCIKARVNEGFTLEDFKKVIDKKVNSWMGTEWQKYLRPETLFGTKFEGYLNETDVKPKGNSFNQMIHTDYDFEQIEKDILWKWISILLNKQRKLRNLKSGWKKQPTNQNVPELYACFGKVLFDEYKWSPDEIEALFVKTSNLWNDLVQNDNVSGMIDWCEQTTSITLRSEDEVHTRATW